MRNTPAPTVVLLSYATHPHMGSEPGVGWAFLCNAIEFAREETSHVHLLCNRRSEAAVIPTLDDTYPDWPTFLSIEGLGPRLSPRSNVVERLIYLLWIRDARRRVREIAERDGHLVAHHVTFATELLPTALPKHLPAGKRIWGPVGSTGDSHVFRVAPLDWRYRLGALLQDVRTTVASWAITWNSRRADLVVAQSGPVATRLETRGVPSIVFPNFFPPRGVFGQHEMSARPAAPPRYRLLTIGQLIPLKRVDLAIRSLALPVLQDASLTIVGDGPERQALVALATDLGVSDRVTWAGELSRSAVAEAMRSSDVLVHPSAREGASGVVAEATIIGLPVVCFSTTGAKSTLEYAEGAGVEVRPRKNLDVSELGDAIVQAAALPRHASEKWGWERLERFSQQHYRL